MTVGRTPSRSRGCAWSPSLPNAASPSIRSQATARAPLNHVRAQLRGAVARPPPVTVAPAKKWLAVSHATVSLVQVAYPAPDCHAK